MCYDQFLLYTVYRIFSAGYCMSLILPFSARVSRGRKSSSQHLAHGFGWKTCSEVVPTDNPVAILSVSPKDLMLVSFAKTWGIPTPIPQAFSLEPAGSLASSGQSAQRRRKSSHLWLCGSHLRWHRRTPAAPVNAGQSPHFWLNRDLFWVVGKWGSIANLQFLWYVHCTYCEYVLCIQYIHNCAAQWILVRSKCDQYSSTDGTLDPQYVIGRWSIIRIVRRQRMNHYNMTP